MIDGQWCLEGLLFEQEQTNCEIALKQVDFILDAPTRRMCIPHKLSLLVLKIERQECFETFMFEQEQSH
jgi:hypothetical protein